MPPHLLLENPARTACIILLWLHVGYRKLSVVSDDETNFTSSEFYEFINRISIKHIKVSQNQPSMK
jgi:hypothetical protein